MIDFQLKCDQIMARSYITFLLGQNNRSNLEYIAPHLGSDLKKGLTGSLAIALHCVGDMGEGGAL